MAIKAALAKVGLLLTVCCAVVLGSITPAAADQTPAWDPGQEWGTPEYAELSEWERSADCEAGEQWTWTSGEDRIVWWMVHCHGNYTAQGVGLWQQPPGQTVTDAEVLPGGVEHVWWVAESGEVVRRWVNDRPDDDGTDFVHVSVTCAGTDAGACAEQTSWVSTGIEGALPGSAGRPDFDGMDVVIVGLVAPGMLWTLLVLPWRLVTALLRPRYAMSPRSPRVLDLTRGVRRARAKRAVRRAAWVVAVTGLLLVVAVAADGGDGALTGSIMLAVIVVGLLALAYRFAAPHPVERGRRISLGDAGARGVAGVALSTVAYGLLPVLLLVYLLLTVYGSIVPAWPVTSAAELAGRPEPLVEHFYGAAVDFGSNPFATLFVLLLPGLLVLFGLDLLGQRLRAADLAEVLAHDRRPHYLYLRSFDEDTLRMPGLLRRRGLIGALTVLRRVRFEEVLVRQLSMTGPVIAIAPPGARLPPIGAARASFSNEEWQLHVEHYARTARAVVLSATPREVRAGFGWEIDLVAHRLGHQRVMVVLGPWPKSQLAGRWRQFCQAVAHLPLFAPMAMPWVPPGVQLLAHSDRQGWRAWGGRSRTDWTYTMAVDQATREYLPDWS